MIVANRTSGGLDVRKYIERFSSLLSSEGGGVGVGPAVCDKNGVVVYKPALNNEFHEALEKVQNHETNTIPSDADMRERFNAHRSFRRGATTRAKEMNVPESIIELNNRWRKVQGKQGGLPRLPMSQLYVEITQPISSKRRFSKSL